MLALELDIDYATRVLLDLLATPSPTGFTHKALAKVESYLLELGIVAQRTPKGALIWTLPGEKKEAKAVISHIDTLGAMVKEIKEKGRLRLSRVGGYDWASIEGAACVLHTFEGKEITATVLNTKQSTHVFGPELPKLERNDQTMELRLDAEVSSCKDVKALGVDVGNFVSFDSQPCLTETGFIKGRHLDNKASVAISLVVTKALLTADIRPSHDTHFFISNYEEVGHGAAAGIPEGTTELLCLDMAAVGEGQASDEYSVTLCVKDTSGPYDYQMNAELRDLARHSGISLKSDIYNYYGSDASAAWRAGGSYRAALIGPGVDASHAYERTHQKAIEATAKLLMAYLTSN
ncbi:MAG: M42 family metallopeptidase [Trueperaceae bacterium]|nr:M42 family metallopeptidase [Trueperaceae bacterium]